MHALLFKTPVCVCVTLLPPLALTSRSSNVLSSVILPSSLRRVKHWAEEFGSLLIMLLGVSNN